jgi:radical SAM protein with 4Fe4S-binding SPASM domain
MMSAQEFLEVCERISGHTKYVYLHVMGEPLLHPELSKMLRILREHGLRAAITTNGTLLAECRDMLLENADVLHKVSVSLHAMEGNGRGSDLSGYLDEVVRFAKDASARGIFTVLRLWNEDSEVGCGQNSFNLYIENYLKRAFVEDWQARKAGSYRIFERVFLEYAGVFVWPSESREEPSAYGRCHGLVDQLAILADGSVCPCCLDSEGDITLGNIFDSSLEEILSSPRSEKMRKGLSEGVFTEKLCQSCSYSRRFSKN